MSVDLYRVNYVAAGGELRSMLTHLYDAPSVGDNLAIDNVTVTITGIKPASGQAPPTILGVLDMAGSDRELLEP